MGTTAQLWPTDDEGRRAEEFGDDDAREAACLDEKGELDIDQAVADVAMILDELGAPQIFDAEERIVDADEVRALESKLAALPWSKLVDAVDTDELPHADDLDYVESNYERLRTLVAHAAREGCCLAVRMLISTPSRSAASSARMTLFRIGNTSPRARVREAAS